MFIAKKCLARFLPPSKRLRERALHRLIRTEELEPRLALSLIPFSAPVAVAATADEPTALISADLDRDGDLDLLAASSDDTITWYSNLDGGGTFGPPQLVSSGADGVRAIRAADLDRDGDFDVLAASANDNTIAWYENTNGLGLFGPEQLITSTADGAADVVAVDLDRDGDLDVVSASADDNSIRWYANADGAGSFGPAQLVISTAMGVTSVATADLDHDGDLDLLSASPGDQTVAWYENTDGAGAFSAARTISTTAPGAQDVFAADVDRDGDADVLSASFDDDTIAWFENTDGEGTFGAKQIITSAADGASAVYAVDLDRDGDLDVIAASANNGIIAWYENLNGNGSFGTQQTISSGVYSATFLRTGDVDGDGDLDVAAASNQKDSIAWYRNETIHKSARFFDPTEEGFPEFYGPNSVAAADVNGDGNVDGLYTFSEFDSVSWVQFTADGKPFSFHAVDNGLDRPSSIVAVDLDRDGDLDAAIEAAGDDTIAWYENTDAAGTFGPQQVISTSQDNPVSIHPEDIDRDGDMDIVSAASLSGNFVWYENTDGQANFAPEQVIGNLAGARRVFTTDLDGDSDADVLAASRSQNTVLWYENDGTGTFSSGKLIDDSAIEPVSVHAGDLDGDGDMDVLASTATGDTVGWYENIDSLGTFSSPKILTSTADYATRVRAVDLDGDGDLDVVWATKFGFTLEWQENMDGQGNFSLPQTISSLAHAINWFDLADYDRDGDVDVVPANVAADSLVWYENRGGQFALETTDTALPAIVQGRADEVLHIDMHHRGRAGDHDEELVSLSLLLEQVEDDPLTSGEANALIDALEIYRDDGSGLFDPTDDTLVSAIATLNLNDGLQTIAFADGDPNVQVAFASPATFFVVTQLTPDAAEQSASQFRITHVTEGPLGSTAEDAQADIPITLELPTNVASIVVQAGLLGDMDRDGDLDLDDVAPFVLGLTDAEEYEQTHGLPSSVHGDIDGDGDHDLDDVDPFVDLLVGGQGSQAEPGGGAAAQSERTAAAQASRGGRGGSFIRSPLAGNHAGTAEPFSRHAAEPRHTQVTDAAFAQQGAGERGTLPHSDAASHRSRDTRPRTRFTSSVPSSEAELAALWYPDQDWLRRWIL